MEDPQTDAQPLLKAQTPPKDVNAQPLSPWALGNIAIPLCFGMTGYLNQVPRPLFACQAARRSRSLLMVAGLFHTDGLLHVQLLRHPDAAVLRV